MYKIYNMTQLTLPIETSVRIPQNDISRYVNEIVETIPDSEFDEFRHHRGATSYHPKMMLKIILYAYTQSVFSGRRIEKLLHDSIRMMWLAQNQTPSYKTINRFRVNPNTDALIESLFIQFHSQCLKQNLIDNNSIFIDGTKVEANANRYTFVWKKSIQNHESKLNENSKALYRDLVEEKIKEGMSTEEINTLVYNYTVEHGAIPAPLNYEGFPKSVCTSINDEVCHGIPDKNIILKNGDIINVDVSTIKDGYFSDASRMFEIGDVSEEAKHLVKVAKECLDKGLEAVKPWGFLGDIGAAVQEHAEKNGYSVVRDFGGHGVGIRFHEDPFVAHIGTRGEGMVLVPGMVFTIEPMLNQGDYHVFVDADNDWTALTEDGSLSAQWEYTVLVTDTGVEILAY